MWRDGWQTEIGLHPSDLQTFMASGKSAAVGYIRDREQESF